MATNPETWKLNGRESNGGESLGLVEGFHRVVVEALPAWIQGVMRQRINWVNAIHSIMKEPFNKRGEIALEMVLFEHERKRADKAVNQFYWDITHDNSQFGQLLFEKMENPKNNDHNRNHLRRVEEYVEIGLHQEGGQLFDSFIRAHDENHGGNETLVARSLLPCVYLAIQLHDAPQLISGKKEGHSEIAALWILSLIPEIANSMNISQDEATRYAMGAAFIVSKHEKDLSLYIDQDASLTQQSAKTLLEDIGELWLGNMPEEFVSRYGKRINDLKQNTTAFSEYFSKKELKVLYSLAKLVIWADKADTAWPGDLGMARTFLAGISTKRPIYYSERPRNASGQQMTPEDELAMIIKTKGAGIGSDCFGGLNLDDYVDPNLGELNNDVWRKLYELTRKMPADILPELTMRNMICAARDARNLTLDLMRGNFDNLNEVYEERMRQLAFKLLKRNRIPANTARKIADVRRVLDVTPQYLNLKNGDAHRYNETLNGIQVELHQIYRALGVGTDRNKVRQYNPDLVTHVGDIFNLVINRLCDQANIPYEQVESLQPTYPFKGYDSAARAEEMRRGAL
jgi:hypothetical protein